MLWTRCIVAGQIRSRGGGEVVGGRAGCPPGPEAHGCASTERRGCPRFVPRSSPAPGGNWPPAVSGSAPPAGRQGRAGTAAGARSTGSRSGVAGRPGRVHGRAVLLRRRSTGNPQPCPQDACGNCGRCNCPGCSAPEAPGSSPRPRAGLDPVGQFLDLVVDDPPLLHQPGDLRLGVHHGGVIAPPECLADAWQ